MKKSVTPKSSKNETGEKKNKAAQLNIRTTEKFKSYCRHKAEEVGMSVSELVQRAVLNANIVRLDGTEISSEIHELRLKAEDNCHSEEFAADVDRIISAIRELVDKIDSQTPTDIAVSEEDDNSDSKAEDEEFDEEFSGWEVDE